MESRNSEMPCKIRKRRFPTASSSSFANNNISQLLVDKTGSDSPRNEKCVNVLDQSDCREDEPATITVKKSEGDDRVNKAIGESVTNVDRSRNKSRTSSGRVPAPEVINSHYKNHRSFVEKDKSFGGMHLTFDANLFQEKSRPSGEVETITKNQRRSKLKQAHGLDEIKQSLTISRELLKLLNHVWTVDTSDGQNPMSVSLASTLNHELNKAQSHVNKLIQEQRSNNTMSCELREQHKIRFAVKTIARELEIEKKLRRQTERMNKKLGRELAYTKSSLLKVVEKAESEKRATEILEQLCEKLAHEIKEDRVELEELKRESEKLREEMEEEREMLRVADILREERVHMKLLDAKYEYEDRHMQVNMIACDLKELLEVDNNTEHLKKIPKVLSWYQSKSHNKGEDENTTREETTSLLWQENNKREMVNGENAHGKKTRGLSWYENDKGEVVNDENALGEKTRGSSCYENNKGRLVNDENALGEQTRGLSWYENDKGEVVNDDNALGEKTRDLSWYKHTNGELEIYKNIIREETTSTLHEVIERYNSDCIELEFGFDVKNESEELNGCLEEEVSHSYDMKEYEDEMERYKMIKDLRDRIVSGSDLSRDTGEYVSYT